MFGRLAHPPPPLPHPPPPHPWPQFVVLSVVVAVWKEGSVAGEDLAVLRRLRVLLLVGAVVLVVQVLAASLYLTLVPGGR
jgi:hypothetical protein